jgi:chromosome partitioning protein
MRKIAIINQKGGVGKTTTAVNLSAALAREGKRVCLADMDPQAHATLHLAAGCEQGEEEVAIRPRSRRAASDERGHVTGSQPFERSTVGVPASAGGSGTPSEAAILAERSIYDLLVGEATIDQIRRRAGENLWLLGSHIDLAAVEVELAGVAGRESILREKLRTQQHRYDYLLIDCPPSLGILTLNALAAVDEVFIPLQPHFLALHGLSKLLETIGLVARHVNPQLRLSGVVLCLYEAGTRLAAEVAGDVEAFLDQSRGRQTPWSEARVFQTRIRRNIRLAEAPSFGQSIFEYAADSHGADDYRQLAAEVMSVGARLQAAA